MKRALLLGGTSDIGFAIANTFASQKYHIILAGRNEEVLARNASDIRIKYNVEAETLFFDASDFHSHTGFWAKMKKKPVVVICVFGYLGDQHRAEHDVTEAFTIMESNYTGAVSILNVIAEEFIKNKGGTIIGVSSVAGDRGRQSNYLYGSAKAGFTRYLQGLRNRLYHEKIHVMTVIPGLVRTKMTEHLYLPSWLTTSPEKVAESTFLACKKKKDIIYVGWEWKYIMLLIRLIPERMFKKMKI